MVEFAIVANVLFLVTFTCIEFARVNMIRNLTQDAAYFAARIAMVPGASSNDAVAEANRIMSSMITNGYTVDVNALDDESEGVAVTVRVQLDQVALFVPRFTAGGVIESTARMKTERYAGFFQNL